MREKSQRMEKIKRKHEELEKLKEEIVRDTDAEMRQIIQRKDNSKEARDRRVRKNAENDYPKHNFAWLKRVGGNEDDEERKSSYTQRTDRNQRDVHSKRIFFRKSKFYNLEQRKRSWELKEEEELVNFVQFEKSS